MSGPIADAPPTRGLSLWQDGAGAARAPLAGDLRVDVAIVGAGFTGLWTGLALTERDPSLTVVVLEADAVAHGASGRNGGFVDPSLTHGIENGASHFPNELDELTRLGRENLEGLTADVARFGIDCDLREVGMLDVATEDWQLAALADAVDVHVRAGEDASLLDAGSARALVDSPTYLGALLRRSSGATVDPGRLARGLATELERRGVTLHETSPVSGLSEDGTGVRLRTAGGTVRADHAVLATNAYSHRVLRATARHFVPVHDYVLVTAPLRADQLARIGWQGREGIADAGNQFHYYRLTPDDRILWGGYDAIYRFGSRVGPRDDHRRATYDILARHFRATFPQLDDVPFERWWGGPIATTTRFTAVFGDALGGRVSYALGYTGLGVASTRFAGRVLTDRLLDPTSSLLDLRFTSTTPFPFPPEPLRWVGVNLTRRAIARADRRGGRRGPWLRTLDAVGIGFDS
ncbi:MAG: FAD-dependent oxidoreductase [Nitriliruptor sp.]